MNTTEEIREDFASLLEQVRQQRDELRVKIHLAGMEMRDEWEDLERQWEHLIAKRKQVNSVASDAVHEVNHAAVELAREIKKAYLKIKKVL